MMPISIKDVMFCANDTLNHTVKWSDVACAWLLENEQIGLVCTFPYLCNALTQMHAITGKYGSVPMEEYRLAVPAYWTIKDIS